MRWVLFYCGFAFLIVKGGATKRFHTHDQLNIMLMMTAGGNFYIRDKIYPISYGSLLVMNPEDLHRNVPRPDSFQQYYSILFYPEEITGFSSDEFDILDCFRNHERFKHHTKLLPDQVDHLLKLISKMEYYLNADCLAYGKSVYCKTLLAEILVFINFLYNVPSISTAPDNLAFAKLQPVLSYIQAHLTEGLTLDVLAKCIRRWPAATVAELSGRCAA